MSALLPQQGPMRLLSRVVSHDAEQTRCAVAPADAALFRGAEGRIPSWVALEWMAQCAAADGSLRLREEGSPLRACLFLGSRRLQFHCDHFAPDASFEVSARHTAGRQRTHRFDCAVYDGDRILAEGQLNVLLSDDPRLLGASA
ncbi:MAG: hypothetical protein AAF430_03970 [Myxococcota bacterium]